MNKDHLLPFIALVLVLHLHTHTYQVDPYRLRLVSTALHTALHDGPQQPTQFIFIIIALETMAYERNIV